MRIGFRDRIDRRSLAWTTLALLLVSFVPRAEAGSGTCVLDCPIEVPGGSGPTVPDVSVPPVAPPDAVIVGPGSPLPPPPDVPEVPEGPEVPEVPVPEVPEVPEAPEVPEVPALPEVPDLPGTPEVPNGGQIPPAPSLPPLPVPAPSLPGTPPVPEAPKPSVPSTGGEDLPKPPDTGVVVPPAVTPPGGGSSGGPTGGAKPTVPTSGGPMTTVEGPDGPFGVPESEVAERVRRTLVRLPGDMAPRNPALALMEISAREGLAPSAAPKAHMEPGLAQKLAELATDAAKVMAFPVGLALAVLLFLMIERRIDNKDPKLAAAPVVSEYESFR